jgi:hypothetical protein
MPTRYDAVLAVLPLLVASGPALAAVSRFSETVLGVGGRLAALPLTPLGLLGALSLVGYALFVLAPARGR